MHSELRVLRIGWAGTAARVFLFWSNLFITHPQIIRYDNAARQHAEPNERL